MPEPRGPAAIGFSSHSGWVAVVCLCEPADRLVLLDRSRWLLTSAPLPCEPYHDGKGRPDEAEAIVASAAEEARKLAEESINRLKDVVKAHGATLLASGVVLGGGRPGATLAEALRTHAAMHGAEGWLFREALIEASQRCGLVTVGLPERDLPAGASAALGTAEGSVSALVQRLGQGYGPPWGRDQKTAAMAAIVALRSLT